MNTFLDFFWVILTSFLFVAYLLVLFQITADIVRDPDSSGWVKAGWVLVLLVLPLLGSLVYLVVRGPSMAERSSRSTAAQGEVGEYIRSLSAAKPTAVEQISEAQRLRDAGVVDDSEFNRLKMAALSQLS